MLTISARNPGNIVTLCLRGKIVVGKTAVLRNVIEAQSEASVIVLDMARVTAIDAHGLGVLLQLREYALLRAIEFRLMNVSRLVGQVLEITRLNSVFNMATDGAALSQIRPGRIAQLHEPVEIRASHVEPCRRQVKNWSLY